MDLTRGSDLPGVRQFEGWRWLVAARVVTSPKAKSRSWDYFEGCARKASPVELEARAVPPIRAPDPPLNYFVAPPDYRKGAKPP